MNKKSICYKLLTVLLCTTILSSCGTKAAVDNKTVVADTTVSSAISKMVTYDTNDYYTEWENETPNYIALTGTSATLKGTGATVKDSRITITSAGVYVISGTLDDGQIIVDVKDEGTVKLVLNGAVITCSDNAPIYSKSAGKTIISLQAGSQNTITDGKKYTSTDGPNAAIFSQDDLTINGTGSLTVNGNYNDGITSKDDLKITGGNIKIYLTDDGLLGKDLVAVKAGTIAIEAVGDGIKASNDTDASKGSIALEGGTFNIKSEADGIQANTSVLISGGTFTIASGGGSANATAKTGENMGGKFGNKENTAITKTDETEAEVVSAKGIKASTDISIGGGTFKIDSSDDALHSSKNVTITGGDLSIATGDDAVHGDETLIVKEGKINVTKSYEGLESDIITILGGEVHIVASDDGINAAAGTTDNEATDGIEATKGAQGKSVGTSKLNINGGYITVDAFGDGLDSNGSIIMTSGTVIVSGPTDNRNGSLDYDGTFVISGGLLIAAGSSGMAQAPSDTSTQYSVIMTYTETQKAGTAAHLEDSTGNTVGTFTPTKDYQSIVISSSKIIKDATYTLYSGGTSTASQAKDGYTEVEYTGGTKVVDFTITNSVTWLNETGVTTGKTSNQGGPGAGGRGNQMDPTTMKTAYGEVLKTLVTNKTITQEQADKVLVAATSNMQGGGGRRPDDTAQVDGAKTDGEKPENDRLSELVTSKVITQAQADTINQKLQEAMKSTTTK
ncbi:MAG: hypothetical protein ACI8WT_003246 [Clostridium sp.]|jgi:hypothetical protein